MAAALAKKEMVSFYKVQWEIRIYGLEEDINFEIPHAYLILIARERKRVVLVYNIPRSGFANLVHQWLGLAMILRIS